MRLLRLYINENFLHSPKVLQPLSLNNKIKLTNMNNNILREGNSGIETSQKLNN